MPAAQHFDARLQHIHVARTARVLVNQGAQRRKGIGNGALHRVCSVKHSLLLQISNAQPLLFLHASIVGLLQPGKDAEQR